MLLQCNQSWLRIQQVIVCYQVILIKIMQIPLRDLSEMIEMTGI